MSSGTVKATFELINKLAKKTPVISTKPAQEPRSLREYTYVPPLADIVAPRSTVRTAKETDRENIFNGKPTICFLQHNDSTSWMPLMPVMAVEWLKMMDVFKTDIYPSIFFHKLMQKIPLAREISRSMTGNSVSSYKEALELLNSDKPYFLATCPEGTNCMFDYGGPVAEFQQYALIKAALASDANVMIISFTQKHSMSVNVKIPRLSLVKKKAIGVKVPFVWVPQNPLNICYEHFEKPISKEDFNALTKEQQGEVVLAVGSMIKKIMETRHAELEAENK